MRVPWLLQGRGAPLSLKMLMMKIEACTRIWRHISLTHDDDDDEDDDDDAADTTVIHQRSGEHAKRGAQSTTKNVR